ncbi:MAG: DUF362 domain-containing protein [Candidatus Thorarchaeota archaeon]
MAEVFIASGKHRVKGIRQLLKQVDSSVFSKKNVAVKANFNSADPFPASTHIDTIRVILEEIKSAFPSKIDLLDRSGMGNTIKVLRNLKVVELCDELGVSYYVLDDFGVDDYVLIEKENHHWTRGFLYAKLFHDADVIVQTCCLKTHQYGGHFTLSLKNSVGMVAKYDPADNYNYMKELHSSPHQRRMIAEINSVYTPAYVLMDAIDAFVSGGPAAGERVSPNVLLLSKDRIAIDAVGVAILRHFGTTQKVAEGSIMKQEQLARAAELGLGISSLDDINLVSLDDEARAVVDYVNEEFSK